MAAKLTIKCNIIPYLPSRYRQIHLNIYISKVVICPIANHCFYLNGLKKNIVRNCKNNKRPLAKSNFSLDLIKDSHFIVIILNHVVQKYHNIQNIKCHL